MVTKIGNKVCRLNSLKLWSAITGVALIVALVLTFLPVQVSVNTEGLLSISFRQTRAQLNPGDEIITLRTQQSKTWYLGGGENEVQGSLSPVHYQDNGWQEIDNSWVASPTQWDYEMLKDDYHVYALEDFGHSEVVRFERHGEYITFSPQSIDWDSNEGSLEKISDPQEVRADLRNESSGQDSPRGILTYEDAYGSKTRFKWTTSPGRLSALLVLDESPRAPAKSIGESSDAVFKLSISIRLSDRVDVYVSEHLWDKRTEVSTTEDIEFRLGDEIIWYIFAASYWDSTLSNSGIATTTLREADGNLWLDVRIPYKWLQTAVYPIYIDPDTGIKYPGTVTTQAAAPESYVDWTNRTNIGADDDQYATAAIASTYVSYRLQAQGFGFSAIPDGSTIDGILVEIQRKASALYKLKDYRVQLLDASGNLVGTNKLSTTFYTTGDITAYYGGATSGDAYWGTALTAALVKDPDFGVVLSSQCTGTGTNTASVDYIRITVYYTVTVVAPTVTTQAATNIGCTSFTANGSITATGGENCHTRGFCYMVGDSGDPTTANSTVYDNGGGSYGIGVYSKSISSLSCNVTYRVRAYAINSVGTGYGTTVSVTTGSPGITDNPDIYDFGILEVNTTSNTTINYFTITNTGNCAVDVTIQGTDVSGGDDTWDLADDANPGENIYGLYAGKDDADDLFDVIVRETVTYNTLVSDLAEDATQGWGLKFYMPTSVSGYDAQQMSGNITLVASAS
jgi:hypothetical protein